jgi:hypothetical protein
MLKAVAWRSGTGKVSIAATSDVSSANAREVQTIDFTFESLDDYKFYRASMPQHERDLRAFPEITGIGASEDVSLWSMIKRHLRTLPVKMLTVSDLDTIWFELQKFSLTLSTVDATLRAAAPAIDPSDPIYANFLDVLTYGGMTGSLRLGTSEDQIDESDSDGDSSGVDLMSAAKVKEVLQLLHGKVDDITLATCIADVEK